MTTPTGEATRYDTTVAQLQGFITVASDAVNAADRMAAAVQLGGIRDADTIGDIAKITEKAMAMMATAQTALDNFLKNHQGMKAAVTNAPVPAAATEYYE